jgi:cyclopropane fatty-acyl-phospholipid synthase-like methyltransferase
MCGVTTLGLFHDRHCDVASFRPRSLHTPHPADTPIRFTHILSIEMFEHMKAYPLLFHKVSTWLAPGGLLFIHIFCHRSQPYHFEESDGWMAQTFFSGGCLLSISSLSSSAT